MSIRTVKFGKLPRKHSPHVKHFKTLLNASASIPTPPASIDNTKGRTSFGMMLNDTLGDCTCAGIYHSKQIWSLNASVEQTEPDNCVLDLYEEACGYRPTDPSNTDNGGNLQDVLTFCTNKGILLNDGSREKFIGFVEVDGKNPNDIKVAIDQFGLVYIGFNVPTSIFGITGDPKPIWENTGSTDIEGGHCVVLAGYDDKHLTVISWGSLYKMTWDFLHAYCDEIYAIVSTDFITSTGKSPLGLSIQDLENLLPAIKDNN